MRVAFGSCLLLACGAAFADTYVVTKSADSNDGRCDSDCSLREAIDASNRREGPDVIRLRHSFYRLTVEVSGPRDSQLQICDDVVIRGIAERSTIDANLTNRHFEICGGARVEMIDLTLRNGRGEGVGGSILTSGEVVLRRVWVIGNRVMPSDQGQVHGGGIYNLGLMRIVRGRIERNVALDGNTLTGGRGGGIFNNSAGTLYMYDTLVRENLIGEDDSVGFGAGLYNEGKALVARSFFGANDPGDGEGGAIANRFGGSLTLANSTLSNNGHDGADGALANGSTIELEQESAGTRSWANVHESTIANNNGGGLLNTGRIALRHVIIGGNYSQDGHDRFYDSGRNCHNEGDGTITQAHSIVGAPSNCPAHIYVDNRTVMGGVIEHLRYLGGPSPVHKPTEDSPAIDGGNANLCESHDQRNKPRPADGDDDGVAVCDIGAMEVQPEE